MSLLSLENISVSFGDQSVLRNISLSVDKGEVVGIIGPNGCGKTTLLNTISGFSGVQTGSIYLEGNDITRIAPHMRARHGIGRSFQHAGIFRDLSVEENIMVGAEQNDDFPWWWMFSKKHRSRMDTIIQESLSAVGLYEKRKEIAGLLSGGQVRLLELARLKLFTGNILLIDEPTAGVSPALREKLADIIHTLNDAGFTILIVEHDLKFLFNLVDRVVVLVDGEKYMEGTPEEVQTDTRLREIYFGKG